MKTSFKIFLGLISLLMVSACATGKIKIPEKYALDTQLEQVTSIYKYGISDWEEVDRQSLILERGPGEYYLLVLKIPAPELPFRNRIKLTSTGPMIRAGLDDLIIFNAGHMKSSYPIERIYKIKGSEQMRKIRDQLIAGTPAGETDNKTVIPLKPGLNRGNSVEI